MPALMRFTTWAVLVATLLLWSGNWIVARAVRAEISPGVATVGRLIVVLAILVPFAWRGLAAKLPALGRRDWLIIAGMGLTGGGVHLGLQWLGLHYTTATSGILYLSTTPIFIMLIASTLGERIGAARWTGVLISLSGVAIIATQGHLRGVSLNVGDLFTISSMAMWAGYTVLLRVRSDPLEVGELLVMVCAIGFVFMLPWLAWELASGERLQLSAHGVYAVLYSALGSLLLAYAGWSYVVTRLGAARAGATLHLMPAMGVGFAALLLGEYPQWYHFAGIALILAGVALSSFRASSAANSR